MGLFYNMLDDSNLYAADLPLLPTHEDGEVLVDQPISFIDSTRSRNIRLQVRTRGDAGKPLLLEVPLHIMGYELKQLIRGHLGSCPDLLVRGVALSDDDTLAQRGILDLEVIEVDRGLRGGARCHAGEGVALWDWDGVIPNTGAKGLKITKGQRFLVLTTSPPFPEWYAAMTLGLSSPETGYVPAAYFSTAWTEPPWAYSRNFADLRRLFYTRTQPPPTNSNDTRPSNLRPPIPAFPTHLLTTISDHFRHGARIRMVLAIDDDDTLHISLSLIPSGNTTRISNAWIKVKFPQRVIVAMTPGGEDTGPATEVRYSTGVSYELSAEASAPPLIPIQATLGAGVTRSNHAQFTRATQSSISGDGIGSHIAFWALREDPGEAGRKGLERFFKMSVKLDQRPKVAESLLEATIVSGEGAKEAWYNSRTVKSLAKRIILV